MISKYSVKKPFTVLVAAIMVIVLGVVSFTKMSTDLLPGMDFPYAVVVTAYPGASPEQVETSVTRPLEQVLGTTSGLENISSTSSENSSMIILKYSQSVNMDSVMIELSNQLNLVEGSLPEGVNTPMIMKIDPGMIPIMVQSFDVDGMDVSEVSKYVNDEVVPEFERIDGVASVSAIGLVENQVKITLNEGKISDINNRILKSVDSALADAQQKLDEAQAQLDEGRAQLEAQSAASAAQLADAQQQLNDAYARLMPIKTLGLTREQVGSAIDSLNEQKAARQAELADAQQRLSEAADDAERLAITAEIEIIESAISTLDEGIRLSSQSLEAFDALDKLEEGQRQLDAGKITAAQSLAQAQMQLDAAESALAEQRAEFEAGRDEALKNAGIDSLITPTMIQSVLTAENFSMPAGYLQDGDGTVLLKVGDKFEEPEDLYDLLLFEADVDGGLQVNLKDVADISVTDNSDESYARINGNPGVMLMFQKNSTSSTADVCNAINAAADDLMGTDSGLHITALMDQGVYINMVVSSVLSNLIYGGILAVIILALFLKDIRPTLIIAVSIPLSLTFAVVLMYFSDITLNIVSLSGLALGVGMLVDNSIVVIENIYRLRGEGKSRTEAAIAGAGQVAGAIFASTLTTVCVFLPIVFTEGLTRELFADMGLTIGYSLAASLLAALTIVPALSSKAFTNTVERPHRIFDFFVDKYSKLLSFCLRHKAVAMLPVLALFIFSCVAVTRMGTAFIPDMDSTQISVTLSLPQDADDDRSITEYADEFIEKVESIEDVDTVGAMQSSSGGSLLSMGGSDGSVSAYVLLKEDKKHTSKEIGAQIEELTADMPIEIAIQTTTMDISAVTGSGVTLVVRGTDLDDLQSAAKTLKNMLSGIDGLCEVDDGLGEISQELRVVVDKNKAMSHGLTVAQVYTAIAASTGGETTVTDIDSGGDIYSVIICDDGSVNRQNLEDFELSATKDNEEVKVKLSDIAEVVEAESPAAIDRENQTRYVSVTAQVDSAHNIGLVSRDVEAALDSVVLPEGCTVSVEGENQTISSTMGDLVLMIALAVLFIYLIMVAQFQSLISPFIVMFTIPLAFTGGLLGLLLTGSELSIIAMLGFLVLSGVVVNNGIVFVDYANQLIAQGMEKREALVETGRTRIRPILMTALTTILAMSTMALGVGMGADMSQPMAIVTIGGLSYATLLTLIVVPVMYDLFRRKVRPSDDTADEDTAETE